MVLSYWFCTSNPEEALWVRNCTRERGQRSSCW